MTIFARLVLFLSSYAPLWLMFILGYWESENLVSEASLFFLFFGIIGLIYIINYFKGLAPTGYIPNIIRTRDDQTMSYVAAYIIPFAMTDFDKPTQVMQLTIFFIVLGTIYINSAMIHINPTLHFFGYKVFEIIDNRGNTMVVITKNELVLKSQFHAVKISRDVYLGV